MDSQWLKTQFDLNPAKTKAGLAKVLGLEPPAVSKILKGTRQIKAQEYAIMRRYFDLPVDSDKIVSRADSYVLELLTPDQKLRDNAKKPEDTEWVIPASIFSQRTKAPSDQIKIFQINENTMKPEFRRGENVVVDLSDKMPSPPGVFIVSDGFGYLVRQCEIVPGSKPVQVKVSTQNESFQPQTLNLSEFEIIGRVIAKMKWL